MKISNLLFTLLFLLGLSACDMKESPAEIASPTVQAGKSGPGDGSDFTCVLNTERAFNLGTTTLSGQGFNYAINLSTPQPYFLKDCICKVSKFMFGFDFLPPIADIAVEDDQGNSLAFAIVPTPNSDPNSPQVYIQLLKPISGKIALAFTSTNTPSLLRANGFCIINNIGAPLHTGVLTNPYEIVKTASASGEHEIYIPTAMTTP